MGRAPNSGGPQRVSAHVVPKAKPFSDDDEKTTIESDANQWGDEPSTTVEQGEVAEKVRALDQAPRRAQIITNVTNTNASSSGVEEPTVDDQGGNPLLATPVLSPARLTVTGGNDTGLEHAINAGKAYTIGRGLDNDIVLTDIAVSRKHFDLRNDGGSWVIVDRGSGNGTVVNGNLEDNPFMLANGDVIEIGNTTFRFDFQVVELPRNDVFDPDDEMSTVAGKPLNAKMLESIDVQMETPRPAPRVTATRPKTLPPPTPLRPRSMTQPPAVYPSQSMPMPQLLQQHAQPLGTPSTALPATTLPMPQMQMQNRASGPHAPTILSGEPINLANLMPTTIPGGMNNPNPATLHHAGAMAPTMVPGGPMHPMYGGGYPIAEVTPHAQMLVVQGQNRRGDLSTAHVPPISYAPLAAVPQPRYSSVTPMEKRTKYVLALAAIAMVVLIVTIAIAKSGGGTSKKAPVATGSPPPPKVTPIEQAKPPHVGSAAPVAQTPPAPPVVAQPQTAPPPKQEPPKQEQPAIVKQDPPKQEPKTIVKQDPPPPPPKQEPPKVVKQDPPKVVVKQDPPKVVKQDSPRQANKSHDDVRTTKPPKEEPTPREAPPKHVATADSTDKADSLYKDKKFNEASNAYATAAKQTSDPDEASQLRAKSQKLALLARAFNNGMAPATAPKDAYDQLVSANNYDATLGSHFEAEITQQLAKIAPKAAMQFAAAHNYEKAHLVVQKAESLGVGGDTNIKFVKQKLEGEAANLYSEAVKEYDSNKDDARDKLKQVKAMLDPKSSTYQKATAKLSGG